MRERTREISHERLAEVAAVYADTQVAAELFDPEWNLIWVSDELKALLGVEDDDLFGVGLHILEGRAGALWAAAATADSQVEWNRANLGYILHETPDEVLAGIVERIGTGVDVGQSVPPGIEPSAAPSSWSYELHYRRPGFPPLRIKCDSRRIVGADGERIGTAFVYSPAMSARVLDLLVRGDERMYERMAKLIAPGRRTAAILFADLQASGSLSRRLPSAVYFRLVAALTTAIDDVVISHGGIVGKHAGDGVTAFFLADDAGSPSAAARAALEAATGITEVAGGLAGELSGEGIEIEAGEVRMNVGVHWGGALYMGQIVTGGRLEVTALGDEVNEAARIQQVARDGVAFASKAVVERLEPADAASAGIDPDTVVYRTVGEIPGADEKTIRDAGGIAVTEIVAAG